MMGWLFYVADVARMPYPDIADQIQEKTGRAIGPDAIYRLVTATRAEYQDREMIESIVVQRMQGESVESMADALVKRRMLYFLAKGDLGPGETAELARVCLQREQISVRRDEAQANLYKIQAQSAEFVAEIITDLKKKEDLFRAASDKKLTGAQKIEQVRLIVYGKSAVSKPSGTPEMREVVDLQAEAV